MITLILADDHPVFASGLRAVFDAESDLTVLEVASTGREAVRAATEHPSGDAASSPEAAFLSTEQRDGLLAAVNELPEDQRIVISLRYFLDLSEQEVAAALDLPSGTVKSRTSRALDRLRELYD